MAEPRNVTDNVVELAFAIMMAAVAEATVQLLFGKGARRDVAARVHRCLPVGGVVADRRGPQVRAVHADTVVGCAAPSKVAPTGSTVTVGVAFAITMAAVAEATV